MFSMVLGNRAFAVKCKTAATTIRATLIMTLARAAAANSTSRLNSSGFLAWEAALMRNSDSTAESVKVEPSSIPAAAAIVASSPMPVSQEATYRIPATAKSQPESLAPAPTPAAQRAHVLASPLATSVRSFPIALNVSPVFIREAALANSFKVSPGCSFMYFN